MKKTIVALVLTCTVAVAGFTVFAVNSDAGREKFNFAEITLNDEQSEILKAKVNEDLKEMLDAGQITEKQYEYVSARVEKGGFGGHGFGFGKQMPGKGKMPEITEEQKEEFKAKIKENLKAKLDAGEITQEQYDEFIKGVESGDFKGFGPDRGFGRQARNGNPRGNGQVNPHRQPSHRFGGKADFKKAE